MNSWVSFGYAGVTWGLWLCAFTVPLLGLTQLIFRNRLRVYWLLVCATVTVYVAGVIAFTMLPLVGKEAFVCSTNPVRLIPFQGFDEVGQVASRHGILRALTSYHFLQFLSNILLFIPFGFIARAVFKRSLPVTTLLAFAASLTIELTQLTGVWGLYACAYRIFDVDDLITNTAGGFIGALIALAWVTLRRREEKPLPSFRLKR